MDAPDEYARAHGLTLDSLLPRWSKMFEDDHYIASTISEPASSQLLEGIQLQECLFCPIIPTPEQWQMPVRSLHLLQQVCRHVKKEEVERLKSQECFSGSLRWNKLKLETPVLRSDHGTDCRRWERRVKDFMEVQLPDHRLPLEPADIDKGQGLAFTNIEKAKDKKMMRDVEKEKLELSKDTLRHVAQSLKSSWTESEQRAFTRSILTYNQVSKSRPQERVVLTGG